MPQGDRVTAPSNRSLALARRQVGPGVADVGTKWFGYALDSLDPGELKAEATKVIARVLKEECGKHNGWSGEWSYRPLPSVKYVNRGCPLVEFRVDLYLAASLRVELADGERELQFVKCLKREVEKLRVPIGFLDALGNGDLGALGQFKVVERDRQHITLDIPGFGELKLRDPLLLQWRTFFKGKTVGGALTEVGLLPPDAENLIDAGLRALEKAKRALPQAVPLGLPGSAGDSPEQEGDVQAVISALTNLAYPKKQAAQAVARAQFPPGASLEEKIKTALQELGKQ